MAAACVLAGCGPPLPEPDSAGAQVLAGRCAGCHRAYAPGSMTIAMWDFQLGRMRGLYAQRGLPWLSPDEERALREYLARFAGSS